MALKSSTFEERFIAGAVEIIVAGATVMIQGGPDSQTSYEMADTTLTIVGDALNEINKGNTLEVLFPGLNKRTTGTVRSIKAGAKKGSTVIKWAFAVEDFYDFAQSVTQAKSVQKEMNKTCAALN